MATPSTDREKLTEKLLKEWEHIENEVLIKEVATKGKHINLLLQFLLKRSGKPLSDVKHYFNEEIDKYVRRLLSNRQVHKAELVLKNVGRKPQALFYEFAQSTSQEHIDDDIKDCVLEHLQNCDKNFDAIREEYDYYLLVLRLVASNKSLRRQFEDEIHVFTLESLLRKSDDFRKLMAVITCLHCKNAALAEGLDKHQCWNYLWQSKQFQYILKWLNLLYANKSNTSDRDNGMKEPCFDIALKNQFVQWDIDTEMFTTNIQNHADLSEYIVNGFAQNGMIVTREKNSIIAILKRVFTTRSFEFNANWIIQDENIQKIICLLLEQKQLVVLLSSIFPIESIERITIHFPKLQDEIELCCTIKNEDFTAMQSIAIISKKCSEYIIKTSNVDFYSKFPYVLLMEHLLSDIAPMQLAKMDASLAILGKISVVDLFLRKLRTTPNLTDYEVSLDEMLQLKNIDLNAVKAEAFSSNGDNVECENELLSFSHPNLMRKYGQPTVLSYINYVKQYRSAYAVYKFFVDQLNTYSQIAQAQIQIACGGVCELAINSLDDNELIAHCVVFSEHCGLDSLTLRAYVNCCRIIKANAGGNFCLSRCFDEDDVNKQTENILLNKIHCSEGSNELFDVHKFEALKILCATRNTDLPRTFLKEAASRSTWFQFLIFAAYHNYSIRSIVDVCQMECFTNRNIGLNIGRALKEIMIEGEAPRRTNSFSYRDHKRKILNRNDASLLSNSRRLSNSINLMEKLPTTKLSSCQQYLNINDDKDMFAVILICACEMTPAQTPRLDLDTIKELMKNPEIQQPNLVRFSIKMKWPLLCFLAAILNESDADYCWIIWLMTSTEITSLPSEIQTYEDLTRYVIKYAVQKNYVRTLHQSFEIFYPDSKFGLFTKFLSETSRYQFTSETSSLLMDFFYELDEGTVFLNSLVQFSKEQLLQFSTTLLIEYVKRSFDSMEHSQQLLDTICASGISNHTDSIDFSTIAAINQIIRFTKVRLNLDAIICHSPIEMANEEMPECDGDTTYLQNECIRISDELVADKAFSSALDMAELFNLSKDTIIYEQWIHEFENDENFDFNSCDRIAAHHSLPPLVLINFLIFVSSKLNYTEPKKYLVLKKVLNLIKQHHLYPNEAIPRDRIEYEMYKCALKNDISIDEIEMYYSEYYETIMMCERGVLCKSFLDLKDLAGIDQLTVVCKDQLNKVEIERLNKLMNRLLEQDDIVQALRLQAIFNKRTIDLSSLAFCMALAEGLANLYDLSAEQKQMLNDGLKQTSSKFDRRTLRLKRLNSVSCSTSASSSPVSKNYLEAYEDITPNAKQDIQDILEAIQSLASRVQYGFKLAQRIVMVFRVAMHLEKEYLDVLQTKDPYILLQNSIDNGVCVNRLLVMSDIITSMQMTDCEIANFIAEQISQAIIKSRFYTLHLSALHSFGQNFLWDYDLDKDFHLFLELCPNTSLLGHNLLRYCDALTIYRQFDSLKNVEPDLTGYANADELHDIFINLRTIMENQWLSYKKQNTITVELLIKAHDCFVYECSMEGIAFVLQRCKAIISTIAAAKSAPNWRLIVKLLMGVGRYRDMYYCFEILMRNNQFECLLGQFDEERGGNGFKDAIISYLCEHHPEDKENYRLAAVHFQMFQELAQINESNARTIIETELKGHEKQSNDDELSVTSLNLTKQSIDHVGGSVLNSAIAAGVSCLICTKSLIDSLNSAMELYAHAADNYLIENKLGPAQQCASKAELIAMQIHFVRQALESDKIKCICVLNIRSEMIFRYLVNNELNIPQSLILNRAYPAYEISWTESIFNQYILQGKDDYIVEFCVRMELTDDMIEHLIKNFLQSQPNTSAKMEKAVTTIIEMVQSVTLRYKFASLLCDKHIIAALINSECLYYLKDTNYGRNEVL